MGGLKLLNVIIKVVRKFESKLYRRTNNGIESKLKVFRVFL